MTFYLRPFFSVLFLVFGFGGDCSVNRNRIFLIFHPFLVLLSVLDYGFGVSAVILNGPGRLPDVQTLDIEECLIILSHETGEFHC